VQVVQRVLGEPADLLVAERAADAGVEDGPLAPLERPPVHRWHPLMLPDWARRYDASMADEPDETPPEIHVPPAGPGETATLTSRTIPGGIEGELLKKEALVLKRSESLRARGHRMLDLAKMETAGRYIVNVDTHELWLHEEGEPPAGRPPDHAFGVTADFGIRWYKPAGVTIDEVLEQDRVAGELTKQAEAEAEKQKRERRKSPPARVITYADVHRLAPGPMTLRAAARQLEDVGAVISVEGGSVYVHATPSESILRLAALVHAAESAVVSAVKSGPGRPGAAA
jgi:hypothetical protein